MRLKKLLPAFVLCASLHFTNSGRVALAQNSNSAHDREIAARLAPIFYQGPGDDFSVAYTHAPFLGVFRKLQRGAEALETHPQK